MVCRPFHRKNDISRKMIEVRRSGLGGDWWWDWAEAWGWTAPIVATMPDCSRDFLFKFLGNEVVGDKDERGKALSVNVERGVGIFCKIVIVCFLSDRFRSDSLYYKMAGTPSSPTRFFIRLE